MFTSDSTIKWVESLAEQESLIHQGERASVDILATKDEILHYETASFLRSLESYFVSLTKLFNSRLGNDLYQIKMQSDLNGNSLFFIQRNYMRLTVTQSKPGKIQFLCDKVSENNPISQSGSSRIFSGMVEANFVHFNQIIWEFLGSPVEAEKLACHYLTEFLQVSRSPEMN